MAHKRGSAHFRAFETLACPHVSNVGVIAREVIPLRFSSRLTVEGERPNCRAMSRNRKPLDAPPNDTHALFQDQEPFTDPMRLALHIQTVPMSLRAILARLTPPTERVRPLRQTLPARFGDPNSMSCLRKFKPSAKARTYPDAEPDTPHDGGYSNPLKTRPTPTTTNSFTKNRCNHHQNLENPKQASCRT